MFKWKAEEVGTAIGMLELRFFRATKKKIDETMDEPLLMGRPDTSKGGNRALPFIVGKVKQPALQFPKLLQCNTHTYTHISISPLYASAR